MWTDLRANEKQPLSWNLKGQRNRRNIEDELKENTEEEAQIAAETWERGQGTSWDQSPEALFLGDSSMLRSGVKETDVTSFVIY